MVLIYEYLMWLNLRDFINTKSPLLRINSQYVKQDNIIVIVLSLYSVAVVLPVCMRLLPWVKVESHNRGAGLVIYTPVTQQLSLL